MADLQSGRCRWIFVILPHTHMSAITFCGFSNLIWLFGLFVFLC